MESTDKICINKEVNDKLLQLYNLITTSTIKYKPTNIKEYFEEIYNFMTLKKNIELLTNVECLFMSDFYVFLSKKLGMVESENHSDIDSIPPNSVISIKIPAVPGYYHFITAVVSIDNKLVDIYQSYGSSRILYLVANLPIDDFKEILKDCKSLSDNKSTTYYDDMLKLRRISRVFSRIFNLEFKALQNEDQGFDYDYDNEDEDEDEDEDGEKKEDEGDKEDEEFDHREEPILKKLMDINFPNQTIRIDEDDKRLGFCNLQAISFIRKDYERFKSGYSFLMNIFTPPVLSGGKNKKKRKTKKLRKRIKQIKQTRRYNN